jgi:diguanylate cyclase (GGDEF)-like protein
VSQIKTKLKAIFGIRSLRARYLAIGVVLVVFLLTSTLISQRYLSSNLESSVTELSSRAQIQDTTSRLRNALWDIQYTAQSILMTPSDDTQDNILERLGDARILNQSLLDEAWIQETGRAQVVERQSQLLSALDRKIKHLLAVRNDVNQLFPAYAKVNQKLLPTNNRFNTSLNLAIEELSDEPRSRNQEQAYQQLLRIRDQWNEVITAFRVYLGSQTLSQTVNEPLRIQNAKAIDDAYRRLTQRLRQLDIPNSLEILGPQTSESVKEMQGLATEWYEAFSQVDRINARDRWRSDVPMFRDDMQPLFISLWSTVDQLEKSLYEAAETDLMGVVQANEAFTYTLWIRLLLTLLVFIAAYLYFERDVLIPVAQIAQAMKLDAQGGTTKPILPDVSLVETQDLVEAYSEMRSQMTLRQNELEHRTQHDVLTGLPNRLHLQRYLSESIRRAEKTGDSLALMMIDLDRFKEINDTLGHQMGDKVLRQLGPLLLSVLEKGELLARLGGDEFAIVLPGANRKRAIEIAEKLQGLYEDDLDVEGYRLNVSGSMGVALYPEHGESSQLLIKRADIAMFTAKSQNLGYVIYEAEQDQNHLVNLELETELRHAIANDELELRFQPTVDIRKRKLVGAEALLYWQTRSHANVSMDEILLLAEHTGLIKQLTLWVLNSAIRQAKSWSVAGLNLTVNVNLSVWNLQDMDFYEQALSRLRAWDLDSSLLQLEITESAVMADPERAVRTMEQLSRAGVHLVVDDYGTGFSSLAYLKHLPVGIIKIDKSFVMDMTSDDNDAVIVRSTIDMAHNLGMRVVAEGVETRETWELLEILRCDIAQGFFIGHPMLPHEFDVWRDNQQWKQQIPEKPKKGKRSVRAI